MRRSTCIYWRTLSISSLSWLKSGVRSNDDLDSAACWNLTVDSSISTGHSGYGISTHSGATVPTTLQLHIVRAGPSGHSIMSTVTSLVPAPQLLAQSAAYLAPVALVAKHDRNISVHSRIVPSSEAPISESTARRCCWWQIRSFLSPAVRTLESPRRCGKYWARGARPQRRCMPGTLTYTASSGPDTPSSLRLLNQDKFPQPHHRKPNPIVSITY